ncbi:MAG: fibronectin type III domain-containing protein [Bdellovibrionota bacterium]
MKKIVLIIGLAFVLGTTACRNAPENFTDGKQFDALLSIATNIFAQAISQTEIEVQWIDPILDGDFSIKIEIKGGSYIAFTEIASVGKDEANSLTMTNLDPATQYSIRLQTVAGSNKSIYTAVVYVTTQDETLVTGYKSVQFTSSSCDFLSCTFNWNWVTPSTEIAPFQSYIIKRETVGTTGSSTLYSATNTNLVSFTEQSSALRHNKSYNYSVVVNYIDGHTETFTTPSALELSKNMANMDYMIEVPTSSFPTNAFNPYGLEDSISVNIGTSFYHKIDLNLPVSEQHFIAVTGPVTLRVRYTVDNNAEQVFSPLVGITSTTFNQTFSMGNGYENHNFRLYALSDIKSYFGTGLDWSDYTIRIHVTVQPSNSTLFGISNLTQPIEIDCQVLPGDAVETCTLQ